MENLQISWLKWKKFPLPAVVFGPPPQIGPAAPPNGDAAQESRTEAAAGNIHASERRMSDCAVFFKDGFGKKKCIHVIISCHIIN